MPRIAWFATALLGLGLAGCESHSYYSPSEPGIPPRSSKDYGPGEKPLPDQNAVDRTPKPYRDDALLIDRPPETRAYLEAYRRVHRPRIVVFVNRTLEGRILGPDTDSGRAADRRAQDEGYLQAGQYDEAQAKAIDYSLIENVLMDWLSADNNVEIVSPTMARNKLTDEQVRDLQAGRPAVMSEVARQLDADVLVQVQARPTQQTRDGLAVRIVAEAMNIHGGQSIARAAADLQPPVDKPGVNDSTRFVARKLMDGMTASWNQMESSDRPETPPSRQPTTRP